MGFFTLYIVHTMWPKEGHYKQKVHATTHEGNEGRQRGREYLFAIYIYYI